MKPRSPKGRLRRKFRVRKKISGDASRPRLSVFKSNKHIYAQLIDDTTGQTIVSASTVDKEVGEKAKGSKLEQAKIVGTSVAERAKAKKITKIVFDRSGFQYHGRVSAIADAAREKGLEF
jgi:large subunit ribosomal protein L18